MTKDEEIDQLRADLKAERGQCPVESVHVAAYGPPSMDQYESNRFTINISIDRFTFERSGEEIIDEMLKLAKARILRELNPPKPRQHESQEDYDKWQYLQS